MPETKIEHSHMVSDEFRAEVAAKGHEIYETKLKAALEPSHNGEYVVIHVDSADYAIGKTFREARLALLARHARDGRVIGWKIGPDPDTDYLSLLVGGAFVRQVDK